ncbi:MAG: hypothetical protein GWP74_12535 [Proteobacteria bacterium]|nr:hypothetical protein [Pseudomonadota bacterium]
MDFFHRLSHHSLFSRRFPNHGKHQAGEKQGHQLSYRFLHYLWRFLFLKFHRLGKAIRATAQNADVAMVCGIDIYRVYLITFGLATALAVAGGTLVSIQFGFNPETGLTYTVIAFAIIVLGGRGHYVGAFIGALMLGVLENLVSFMVPNGTAMVEMAAYGTMVLVLLVRPRGLFGPKVD